MKAYWGLILLLSFILIGCKKTPSKIIDSGNYTVSHSKFAQDYPFFEAQLFADKLKQRMMNDSVLGYLYEKKDYSSVWISDTLKTKELKLFINLLVDVEKHGLPSNYIKTDQIVQLLDSIDYGHFNEESLYDKLIDLERLSTNALIRYTKGMNYGFVNPQKLFKKTLYDIELSHADSVFYHRIYEEALEDPIKTMEQSVPQSTTYLILQKEYMKLKRLEYAHHEIKDLGTNVYKVGDKHVNIEKIANLLASRGFFEMPVAIPDSLMTDSLRETQRSLTPELMSAINNFRKHNSIEADKEIGNFTIEALNRKTDYYLKKLRVGMERNRWQRAKEEHDKHIEVNVAPFLLFALEKEKEPLIMRVCVGRPYHKTPLLESNLGYINLNPKWNVPVSIARNEISVLQKRDQTYMQKRNMKLYKGNKEIDPSSIDWSKVNPAKFNYRIVQGSGGGNSLGRLKFMFNNDFSVYLHDTPLKSAFLRTNRAVSHGCVRVQQPLDLAFFCTDADDIYKDRIRYSIGYDPQTKEGKEALKKEKLKKLSDIINLLPNKKISLAIDYHTAYLYPNDSTVHYADDLYEYDDIILNALSL